MYTWVVFSRKLVFFTMTSLLNNAKRLYFLLLYISGKIQFLPFHNFMVIRRLSILKRRQYLSVEWQSCAINEWLNHRVRFDRFHLFILSYHHFFVQAEIMYNFYLVFIHESWRKFMFKLCVHRTTAKNFYPAAF